MEYIDHLFESGMEYIDGRFFRPRGFDNLFYDLQGLNASTYLTFRKLFR